MSGFDGQDVKNEEWKDLNQLPSKNENDNWTVYIFFIGAIILGYYFSSISLTIQTIKNGSVFFLVEAVLLAIGSLFTRSEVHSIFSFMATFFIITAFSYLFFGYMMHNK